MPSSINKPNVISIGSRLKSSRIVTTLGLRPNFYDYSPEAVDLIRNAEKIYYPTAFYADLLNTMGKATFPSFHTYKYAQDKIKQTAIFYLLGIPHPRTRVYYGKIQKKNITCDFKYPFIAKQARGSAKGEGIYLIRNDNDLQAYLEKPGPAYIQEYIQTDRDMRIIIIGKEIALAYWRIAAPGEFRANLSQGGSICFDPIPEEAAHLAISCARRCGWNDVGIDIIPSQGEFMVLEGNMKYGTKGFKAAGINYVEFLEHLILSGKI